MADFHAIICRMGGKRQERGLGWLLGLAVVGMAALSGCTSASVGFQTHFGQQAIELAQHVPGCSKIRSAPPLAKRTISVATCVIGGRRVEFLAFADEVAANQPVTSGVPAADAHGPSWDASLVSADARLDVQRRIMTQVAKALHGRLSILR